MSITTQAELDGVVAASRIARDILSALVECVRPGHTTAALDRLCGELLSAAGAVSAPKRHYDAPCHAFYSLNDVVVHGLPDERPLEVGDVVSIDVTPEYRGFVADTARTVVVGGPGVNGTGARLIAACEAALDAALAVVRAGVPVNRIGGAIERSVHSAGFHVVRELCGHGLGRTIHEEPTIPNYRIKRQRDLFGDGMVVAIEPMIAEKRPRTAEDADGWSIGVGRGNVSAHLEHTLVVTAERPLLLTA
ncbi:MAG: type I methionyl aminopeptidase [Spirochaetales bacterium]|nr:type I methionyl aminopeptidase [Spirochaetales bacterium]